MTNEENIVEKKIEGIKINGHQTYKLALETDVEGVRGYEDHIVFLHGDYQIAVDIYDVIENKEQTQKIAKEIAESIGLTD